MMDIQLNESTNQSLIKVPKVAAQQIRKHYYKTLGTSIMNSPMSPSSLQSISPKVAKLLNVNVIPTKEMNGKESLVNSKF